MSARAHPTRCLRSIEDTDNERQANRLMDRMNATLGGGLDSKVERDIRITMYGWLAMTMEMCRQRIMDPSIDAGQIADTCAHALLDMVGRVPVFRTHSASRSRSSDAVHDLRVKKPSRRVDESRDPMSCSAQALSDSHTVR